MLNVTNFETRIGRCAALFLGIALAIGARSARGQEHIMESAQTPVWVHDPSMFLEPNNFTVEKELLERSLWLRVGYGPTLYAFGPVSVGLEGLAWSRLETLSQFRFPVQTVDYFFGAFGVWHDQSAYWRVRLSHISSHWVDGADSMVIGGASSKYSREFIELTREVPSYLGALGDQRGLSWSVGLRFYFHQVTHLEPAIAVPASITWRFADLAGASLQDYAPKLPVMEPVSLFVSSGDGPVWPSVAGGLRYERIDLRHAVFGLELYYYYGASWAGVDAGATVKQLKLQLDVRGF